LREGRAKKRVLVVIYQIPSVNAELSFFQAGELCLGSMITWRIRRSGWGRRRMAMCETNGVQKIMRRAVVASLLLWVSATAYAQNLVVNPSFETMGQAGWAGN